jgi:hypothetical protein
MTETHPRGEAIMLKFEDPQALYRALDQLAKELRGGPHDQLGKILHARLHEVAWNGRSEFMEDMETVLDEALAAPDLNDDVRSRLEELQAEVRREVREEAPWYGPRTRHEAPDHDPAAIVVLRRPGRRST